MCIRDRFNAVNPQSRCARISPLTLWRTRWIRMLTVNFVVVCRATSPQLVAGQARHHACPESWEVSMNLTLEVRFAAQAAKLLDQSLAGDPEDARGAALVARGDLQHLADVLGLDLRERRQIEAD